MAALRVNCALRPSTNAKHEAGQATSRLPYFKSMIQFQVYDRYDTVTPLLTLGGQHVKYVNHYKYLGVVGY